MSEDGRISVVLVTGAVGAGKTAAVDALLAALPPGAAAAVCTHEFALAFGLEAPPVHRDCVVAREEVFDFGGGCVCCSPRGDFARLLSRLWEEHGANASAGRRLTHLLLETTGVAEPLVFAKLLVAEPRYRLDAIVCVVDAAAPPPTPAADASLDDAIAPAWAAAAAAQLAAASCVCVNVRRSSLPEAADAPAVADDGSGPQQSSVSAGMDAGVELAVGVGGAASDLASVLLDTASQLASVALGGAGGVLSGVASGVTSLAQLDVGGTTDALGAAGAAGLETVTSSAGLLLGAASELSAVTVDRAGQLSQCAMQAAANVTVALIDDTAALPGAVGGLGLGAAQASFGVAATVVSVAAGAAALAAERIGGAPSGVPQVVACLADADAIADAGAALWTAIAGAGAFQLEAALALDASFLEPAEPADAPLFPPLAGSSRGHAARVTCVCVAETGTPLLEHKLRSWLASLAADGRVLRAKGIVFARAGLDDTAPPRKLLVDGVRDVVVIRERELALCGASDAPLCSHAAGADSKIFLVLAPGEQPALVKKAFRQCFVPDEYAWAADAEIDFPPPVPDAPPRGIERQLENGPKIVLWRVGARFYACEAECPHAGAPLVAGAVLDMEDAASTSMGPLLSCAYHMFTWDLASGAPVSALGCGALRTFPVLHVLGSLYVGLRSHNNDEASPQRKPSWRC